MRLTDFVDAITTTAPLVKELSRFVSINTTSLEFVEFTSESLGVVCERNRDPGRINTPILIEQRISSTPLRLRRRSSKSCAGL